MIQHYLDVILPLPLNKAYTYALNDEESERLVRGVRVAVPFGKSRIYTAIAFRLHNEKPKAYEPKPIHQILDDHPIVNELQFEFWEWISDYYMCTLGEVVRAGIPSGFLISSETYVQRTTDLTAISSNLTNDEYLILEALEHQKEISVEQISSILNKKTVLPLLYQMVEKGFLNLKEQIQENYKPQLVRYVKMHEAYASDEKLQELLELLSRAPKQREAILTFFQLQGSRKSPIKVKELTEQGVSSAILRSLIDKDILQEYFLEISRLREATESDGDVKELSEQQNKALNQIRTSFKQNEVCLLHGVTASGKTELYFKLIEEALNRSQQVLYLLPEIALTTQLVKRLELVFGERVLVYHSRYSLNERVEIWKSLQSQSAIPKVVIGARSAIFLPFSSLGLIIIDEEHEASYKQFDPAPRYHARDAAIYLGRMVKAAIVLGSATPSIESYFNAIKGKYTLVSLKERFKNIRMPEIELVDLTDKYKRKRMTGHFSDRLIEEMKLALEEKQQIILFQNRRGYSPIVECLSCGHSPQCINCDVSLTYHQYKNELRCHYCGSHSKMHLTCEACGNSNLDTKGFGTEQIEKEAKNLFPKSKVARMDLDTTRGKYSFERLIQDFEHKEIDILIGTQMVTKGLDFRDVKLVGVLNADNLLNFPDFRSHERSYQLLAQVSGRAGRTDERGKVIIQTYNPYHKILQQVSINDYEGMYKEQIEERHQYHYPPIYRLIKITLKHKQIHVVNTASEWFSEYLRQYFKSGILGPEFPPIARIRNQYHKNILIKIPQQQSLLKTKEAINKIYHSFQSVKDFRAVRVIINVDNY